MHVCRGLLAKKTASYAIMHLVVAIIVAYALTGDWAKALAIGIIEPIIQTFAFTLHDRYWTRRQHDYGSDNEVSAGTSDNAAPKLVLDTTS